jgi:lipoprotein-anchoring transpeptidase ErfK/SrfK
MSADPTQIRSMIQNAREALRRGDQAEARRWAEQSARLAPNLEDAWLILAAVSSPRASLAYAQRAQTIHPQSQRARKAVEWARSRAGAESAGAGAPTPSVALSAQSQGSAQAAAKKSKGRSLLGPILSLVGLACIVVAFAAWSVGKSSALASIVRNANHPAPTPTFEMNFAAGEVSKPTYTPEWTAMPTLTPTLTHTPIPSITPTLKPAASTPLPTDTSLPTDTPGVLEAAIVPDTPTPLAPPTSAYVAPTQKAYVPPGSGGNGAHWIDINLSTQQLFAYEGDVMVNAFLVSTGVSATPTVTGTYKIYARYLYADMHGPGYFLPDVPYTMYFYKSYGIHGTYWHNNFGTPMSHGCVNMSISDAGWLYNWSTFGTTVKVHY